MLMVFGWSVHMSLKDEKNNKNIVTNFDAFSVFMREYIYQATNPKEKRKNVLYIHTPFCLKKC